MPVPERSEEWSTIPFRLIETRLNAMESQIVNNIPIQNQMSFQSLFFYQNQLITGLADRQCNCYARVVPAPQFQYPNQPIYSMGHLLVTCNLLTCQTTHCLPVSSGDPFYDVSSTCYSSHHFYTSSDLPSTCCPSGQAGATNDGCSCLYATTAPSMDTCFSRIHRAAG